MSFTPGQIFGDGVSFCWAPQLSGRPLQPRLFIADDQGKGGPMSTRKGRLLFCAVGFFFIANVLWDLFSSR
jgi:hypothetical protein